MKEMREKYGIPDLRRAARFRYASITPLEVDGSIRKLLKSGRELDDSLIAAIIRNLKMVKDSSRVIVLDADGTRSKGIARSLRKIGLKASLSIPAEIFSAKLLICYIKFLAQFSFVQRNLGSR
ncbi:hypothetical protein GmHk_18G050338 [Glycine max]|nr:hypothetical protein GmHk_18G050338 [Glycine max]